MGVSLCRYLLPQEMSVDKQWHTFAPFTFSVASNHHQCISLSYLWHARQALVGVAGHAHNAGQDGGAGGSKLLAVDAHAPGRRGQTREKGVAHAHDPVDAGWRDAKAVDQDGHDMTLVARAEAPHAFLKKLVGEARRDGWLAGRYLGTRSGGIVTGHYLVHALKGRPRPCHIVAHIDLGPTKEYEETGGEGRGTRRPGEKKEEEDGEERGRLAD